MSPIAGSSRSSFTARPAGLNKNSIDFTAVHHLFFHIVAAFIWGSEFAAEFRISIAFAAAAAEAVLMTASIGIRITPTARPPEPDAIGRHLTGLYPPRRYESTTVLFVESLSGDDRDMLTS